MRDVVEASREVPVLVDFWAPWCGPCRQLTPILEKAVRAAKGAVKLVKLNIDDHPQIPGQMGVQSIPAVFAFQDGRPVDGFMGALPESRVKSFIARLIGEETADVAADMEDAEVALAAGDVNSAAQSFGEALQKDAENARAAAGLAKCYIKTGDLTRAEQTLALVPPAKADSAPVASARASLELARKAADTGDVELAPRQACGQSQRHAEPLRSCACLECERRPSRRARRAPDHHPQGSRLQRRCGPQADAAAVRRLGRRRSCDYLGPTKALIAVVCVRARRLAAWGKRSLPRAWRSSAGAAHLSVARRHSPTARHARAERVRAALSRARGLFARRRPPHRHCAAGARGQRQRIADRQELPLAPGGMRRADHRLQRG